MCLDIEFVWTLNDFVKGTINHIGCTLQTDFKNKQFKTINVIID